MDGNIVTLIQIVVTIIIAFITAILTNSNERKKQTTVFFKQEGIKTQQEILNFWCSILFYDYDSTINKYKKNNTKRIMEDNNIAKPSEITDTMVVKVVQRDSYMYSSKITIKYIGNYMQEIFKEKEKSAIMKQMFLVSKIICNMKYDFTGERTSVMDLLKMKINDLDFKKKLKVYAIGGIQKCADRFVDCSPFEVLAYFRNAEEVITDTFHGSIFSVVTHRPFTTLIRKSVGNSYGNEEKLSDLLERLELANRMTTKIEDAENINETAIDYAKVDERLKAHREVAKEYLRKNLEE